MIAVSKPAMRNSHIWAFYYSVIRIKHNLSYIVVVRMMFRSALLLERLNFILSSYFKHWSRWSWRRRSVSFVEFESRPSTPPRQIQERQPSGSQGLWIQKWRINFWISLWIDWTVFYSLFDLRDSETPPPSQWTPRVLQINRATMAKHKSTSHPRRWKYILVTASMPALYVSYVENSVSRNAILVLSWQKTEVSLTILSIVEEDLLLPRRKISDGF